MPTDLYIYYRVPEHNADALTEKVHALQATLAQRLGVATALKRRPFTQDGLQTWMEVYLATQDGFEAYLDAAVADHALLSMIDGKRHVEQFVDITSCA